MAKMFTLTTMGDERGKLTVIEKELPFAVVRAYYIYDVPADIIRGGHRHLTTRQVFIAVSGRCVIKCDNGDRQDEFVLSTPEQYLLVEPEDWHEMYEFSEDCVLLVLASWKYDANDYIFEKY